VSPIPIADDCVVTFHYQLTLEDGTVADSTRGGEAFAYLHGHHGIVPGLERQLGGRQAGDKLQIEVPPAEGYGEFDPAAEQQVPRAAFPEEHEPVVGMMFHTESRSGEPQPIWVKALSGDQVTITRNHPLAGRTLTFAVEIVGVRRAKPEELTHGHVHGPGGHHHH